MEVWNEERKREKILSLCEEIQTNDVIPFYKNHWGATPAPLVFDDLKILNLEMIRETPLADRMYVRGKGITKIVKNTKKPFLVKWTLDTLSLECFGEKNVSRPLVLMSDSHEALEKAMWYYEHGIIPLVGEERSIEIALRGALQYEVDSLLLSFDLAESVIGSLKDLDALNNIKSTTIISGAFEKDSVQKLIHEVPNIRFVLAFPETGTIGVSCPEAVKNGELVFHSSPHSYVEIIENTIIVTRTILLSTPIIRYKTISQSKSIGHKCSCAEQFSFQLLS